MGTLTVLLGLTAALVAPTASGAPRRSGAAFAKTETISRSNLVHGAGHVVDKRTFSMRVDQTNELRDRQEITVSWKGAHPTGGIVADPNSALAAQQEYPVVLMMCRGVSSSSAPAAKQISPNTCWTQTPAERFQFDNTFNFPPYRLDRYASRANRALSVAAPKPLPKGCLASAGAQHWVPFDAASGKLYKGGPNGCAGIAPEAANFAASLQPGNTTYAASNLQGKGADKFVITTSESNASLGCSDTVPCSLVVIPIMGISCDPAGDDLPPVDRPNPAAIEARALALCSQKGAYKPGAVSSGFNEQEDLAVSGELWWSASNWRNRIAVPLTFAPPSDVCALVNKSAPTDIYGSYLLLQATQQWAPHFCLNPKSFRLQHIQTSEPEAKNLLSTGSVDAAFQGSSPSTPFAKPVVQAPTAITGFAVGYAIDTKKGQEYVHLRLDARLLAKLLTESYPSNSTVRLEDKGLRNPKTHQPNPLDLAEDPEFQALNPGLPKKLINPEAAATILSISSDSDIMTALTTYINDDREARAWLNGKPDPWGMVVNPNYKGIKLPVSSFPLLDTFEPPGLYQASLNPCLADDPTPWLPLVASPVEDPATITLDLQFDIASSQIECSGAGTPSEKLTAIGRETPGQRFILGITSLADAKRYELDTASLQTHDDRASSGTFTSSAGRSFASPSDASLRTAANLMRPDKATGSWPVPYKRLRTDPAAKSAYPGTMLVSTDVPTSGLSTANARDYSQFLDFVATTGQTPGVGNGELPPGYLPMTTSNGLGRMVNYTKIAAAAVAAQSAVVPSVTARVPSGKSSGSPSPTSSQSSGSGGSDPSGSGATKVPVVKSPGASSGGTSPTTAASPHASSSPATTTLSTARTAALSSTAAGLVFPLVLLLALITGAATVVLWRLDRPKATS
jgi:hypothetical protein